jgi:pre-mRNA-splicing factor CWC26
MVSVPATNLMRPSKNCSSGTADKHRSRSDRSPPRRLKTSAAGERCDSDSDRSPPRRKRHDSDKSPPRRREASLKRNSQDDRAKSSPGRSSKSGAEKRTTTLEGKRAGLQSGKDLRKELEAFRRREDEAFRKMDKSMTGQNAQTNLRAGKRRELEEKLAKEREKEENLKKLKEATEWWSKGVKQQEAQSARLAQDVQEMSKPLARFAVDEDLERMLRKREREGDFMGQYMAKKKAKSGEGKPVRPTYKGPPPPSNRFGIPPGYRWDGVDRSSGFEKMYLERKNKAVAIQDEAYKWSVSDM